MIVTEAAVAEVKRVMQENGLAVEDNVLRVHANGGGCSGLAYSLGLEARIDINELNDMLYTYDGLNVVVDRQLDARFSGVVVDFYDGEDRKGFTFQNPTVYGCSTKSCGSCCG
jgi:iron-sulfur cluster assembly protein